MGKDELLCDLGYMWSAHGVVVKANLVILAITKVFNKDPDRMAHEHRFKNCEEETIITDSQAKGLKWRNE